MKAIEEPGREALARASAVEQDRSTMTREEIEAIRRQRDQLVDQVRKSQETIARSEELIRQFDAILAEIDGPKR
jgi:uncharacterized coiled-coil DUF342 family protein